MRGRQRRACSAYQDALLDFVDRRSGGPEVEVALRHLDRCPECERELAATAVVLAALHRLWEETRSVEPSPDAWPRLRARIAQRPAHRWQPGTVAGLVAGAGLVLALLAPAGLGLTQPGLLADTDPDATPVQAALSPHAVSGPATERDGVLVAHVAGRDATAGLAGPDITLTDSNGTSLGGSVPTAYPDNIRPTAGQRPAVTTQRAGPPIQTR